MRRQHPGTPLFMLARVDAMLRLDDLAMAPPGYFARNVWVTTSGLFSIPPVMCTVQVLGVDRVMFSVDYPFGRMPRAAPCSTRCRSARRTRPRSRAATPSACWACCLPEPPA